MSAFLWTLSKAILRCCFLILIILPGVNVTGQVGINGAATDPHPSAMLDVQSLERGFLPPRMTTAQRNAIASPASGLMIFNTDTECLNLWTGGAWKQSCFDCSFGIPAAGSNSPICEGSTLQLIAPEIVGASYQWHGPGEYTSDQQNPQIQEVSASNAGFYHLTVSRDGCTSIPVSIYVTVNQGVSEPEVNGGGSLCAGDTLFLSTPLQDGAFYSWNGPNGFASFIHNPEITGVGPIHSGNYTLTISVNGCTSPPAMFNVVVNTIPDTPIASANTSVCQGETLSLSASVVSGAEYSWSGPSGFESSLQNPQIEEASPDVIGIYSVVAVRNGCVSPAGEVEVNSTCFWTRRVKISSNDALVDAAFPFGLVIDCGVLFSGNASFWNAVQSTGADIRIMKSDGVTELPRGVRDFNVAQEQGIVYFRADDLSVSESTDYYIYWGNTIIGDHADNSSFGLHNVWSTSHRYYSSMSDLSTSTVPDLTSNGNTGTKTAANRPLEVDGVVGFGQRNQQSGDFINAGSGSSLSNVFAGGGTIGFWMNASTIASLSASTTYAHIFNKNDVFIFFLNGTAGLAAYNNNSFIFSHTFSGSPARWTSPVSSIPLNSDAFVVITYNNNSPTNDPRLFINGNELTLTSTGYQSGTADTDSGGPLCVMNKLDGTRTVDGRLDEVFIYGDLLNQDEIRTIFQNQSNQAGFWSVSTIETLID